MPRREVTAPAVNPSPPNSRNVAVVCTNSACRTSAKTPERCASGTLAPQPVRHLHVPIGVWLVRLLGAPGPVRVVASDCDGPDAGPADDPGRIVLSEGIDGLRPHCFDVGAGLQQNLSTDAVWCVDDR